MNTLNLNYTVKYIYLIKKCAFLKIHSFEAYQIAKNPQRVKVYRKLIL